MIANIWKNSYGWLLELSAAAGQAPTASYQFATKTEAKRAAKMHGAAAWNY